MDELTRRRVDSIITERGRHMSQRDIAQMAGVSLGYVNKRVRQLDATQDAPLPTFSGTGRARDAGRLDRLIELRDALLGVMRQTGGRQLARLSREYRATLGEIAEAGRAQAIHQ